MGNYVLAVLALVTAILHAVVLLTVLDRSGRCGAARPTTTEAAPSGAASVGLPTPANGVRIVLTARSYQTNEREYILSPFISRCCCRHRAALRIIL